MTARILLDTNILIYALVGRDGDVEDLRTAIAEELLAEGGTITVQMLTEFTDVLSRKYGKSFLAIARMLEGIEALCGPALPLTSETHRTALELSRRHGFRIFDSMVVASAIHARCSAVYTEDLQHGQVIEGVRIENPFLPAKK